MAKARPIDVDNLRGGLDLSDRSLIADNALSVATNMFYNQQQLLQSRYGVRNFGEPIPTTVVRVHAGESTTAQGNWSASDDADTLTASGSQKKRGTAALNFNITVAASANDYATISVADIPAFDVSAAKGYIGFFVYVPTGGKTNLTDCRLRVGSDSSNYYEFTVNPSDLTEAQWNFVAKTFAGATTSGTPVDTTMVYSLFRVNYAASYTNKTGWGLDDIYAYSSTASSPAMSLKYFKSSSQSAGFPRYLTCNAGTNLFEYDETTGYWSVIKTGLTSGTRFTMTAYRNIMNFSNGVDNYFSYDGATAAEHTGANTYKGKYLLLANDIGYILGDPTVPSSLAYTNATPANLQTFPNVLVLDEDSSDGKGTALINLGPVVIAAKDRKIYKVNVATPSREQLDYSDGILSHRAFIRVENEVFGINSKGVITLAQREATTGSLRSDPLSAQLQPLLDLVKDKSISAGIYVAAFNNVYISLDTNLDGIPESLLVFSILTRKWTQYSGILANEFVYWEDGDGDYHLLYAHAAAGRVVEMETGTNDNNSAILNQLETKNFHFNQPATLKTFTYVDVEGFISEAGVLEAYAIIDDSYTTPAAYIDGSEYYVAGGAAYTLGTSPLGTTTLGGSPPPAVDTVPLYYFKKRIPIEYTGARIRLKFEANTKNTVFIIQKFTLYPIAQTVELFEASLIA